MRTGRWTLLIAMTAGLAWLSTGCTTSADDDDSAGDDDDAGGDEAPVISNLDLYMLVYGDLGGDTGFQWEQTYLFGIQLVDRGGNESNELEQEFTIPPELH